VRWTSLFADLEAQLEAAQAAELELEVRDRSRRESSLVRTADRLRATLGAEVTLVLPGVGPVAGLVRDAGEDWVLLEQPGGREALVRLAALLSVTGLGRRSVQEAGEVARRLDLRWALRGLARSRTAVQVVLVDGSVLTGTLDRVGADHVDLAEHLAGQERRAPSVLGVRLVPLHAVALVRSA
jgi:hypothetical protein